MSKPKISATPADGLEEYLLNMTRRRFFGTLGSKFTSTLGAGLGGVALAQLLAGRAANAAASPSPLLAADGTPAGAPAFMLPRP